MTSSSHVDETLFVQEDAVDFNPLEAFDFQDDNEEGGVLAEGPFSFPNPEAVPAFQKELVSFANGDTATERIEALFDQMPTLQHMLFGMLDACAAPLLNDELVARVEEMKAHHHTVYAPLTLASLLERAGALMQTDAEGIPLTEVEQEPLQVEVDGVAFWRVAPAPTVYWSLTEEGAAKLDSYRPLERIAACFAEEPRYAPIFTTCLEMTAQAGGVSLRALGDVVDDEPVLQSPKRFAMYFIDKLEHAGAVEWTGQWSITEHGRAYLKELKEN